MTTLTAISLVLMSGTPVALFLAWVWADEWLAGRAEDKRRVEQGRVASLEWLAKVADEPTPVYDSVCFDLWEAECRGGSS